MNPAQEELDRAREDGRRDAARSVAGRLGAVSQGAAVVTDLTLDEATHTYRLGDRVLPSVTQITATIAPLFGIPRGVLEAKADLGTAVHLATQFYDEGDLDADSLPESVGPYFRAYAQFLHDYEPRWTHIEHRVHHPGYGYAGTLDRAGYLSGLKGVRKDALCLVDLKATYRIAPVYSVQTALYARALDEAVQHRFALQLKPDGTYRLEEFRDPSDLSVGLAALTLLNWRARHAERI